MLGNKWIVIADAARARILKYQGPSKELILVEGGELSHINELSQNLTSTERGRVFKSASSARSAMERRADPHTKEKLEFAREISEWLEKRIDNFDRLILVAPAQMLGNLRSVFPNNILTKIDTAIDKDLTKFPIHELPKYLSNVLVFDRD